jgi:hypothetical protein
MCNRHLSFVYEFNSAFPVCGRRVDGARRRSALQQALFAPV